MSQTKTNELILPLPNGGTLRCGAGEEHEWGGYLRICAANGGETQYWDKQEWQDEPEQVIGAVFAAARQEARLGPAPLTVAQLADALAPLRQQKPDAVILVVTDKFDTELLEVSLGDDAEGADVCWLVTADVKEIT